MSGFPKIRAVLLLVKPGKTSPGRTFPHPLPTRVSYQEKIAGRMTGTGLLALAAIGLDGRHHRLVRGPAEHLG
jgi:hypothetical protein